MKYISDLNCDACGARGPNDLDHIKTRGSGGTDEQFNLLVLCRSCHQKRHQYGLNALTQIYTRLSDVLLSKGWSYDNYKGRWTRYNN